MTWHAVSVSGTLFDRLPSLLFEAGAAGIHEEDSGRLTAFFSSQESAAAAAAAVLGTGAAVQVATVAVPEVDWVSEWRQQVKPISVGMMTIVPPWLVQGAPDERVIVIDPGMGFGTGEHASTRTALLSLQRCSLGGALVADVGTGSGVLAIAAARLGARGVVAIESDGDAVRNAARNISLNGVESRVSLVEGDAGTILPLVGPFDVVVSNITADVHCGLLDSYARSVRRGGRLVLAGILETEASDLLRVAIAQGWVCLEHVAEGDWWSCILEL